MCLALSSTLGRQKWGNKLVFAHKSVIIYKNWKSILVLWVQWGKQNRVRRVKGFVLDWWSRTGGFPSLEGVVWGSRCTADLHPPRSGSREDVRNSRRNEQDVRRAWSPVPGLMTWLWQGAASSATWDWWERRSTCQAHYGCCTCS